MKHHVNKLLQTHKKFQTQYIHILIDILGLLSLPPCWDSDACASLFDVSFLLVMDDCFDSAILLSFVRYQFFSMSLNRYIIILTPIWQF